MRSATELPNEDYRSAYMLLGACIELGAAPELWCRRLSQGLEQALQVHLSSFFEGSFEFVCGRSAPAAGDRYLLYGDAIDAAETVLGDFWKQPAEPLAAERIDPVLAAWIQVPGHAVTRTRQQLVQDKQWYESAVYRDYFRRASLGDTMLARFPSGGGKWLLLNLWRQAGGLPFTERDQQFVQVLTAELALHLRHGRLAPLAGLGYRLSPRLAEVLQLLRDGMSEKAVAYELGISRHTVHNHVKRLHSVFGATSRSSLLALTGNLPAEEESVRFGSLLPQRGPHAHARNRRIR